MSLATWSTDLFSDFGQPPLLGVDTSHLVVTCSFPDVRGFEFARTLVTVFVSLFVREVGSSF